MAEMSLGTLRAERPDWQWSAERSGFGWQYIGRRGARTVRIYAVAVHVGPAEDDYSTQWRVDDGQVSAGYAAWWIEQESERDHA